MVELLEAELGVDVSFVAYGDEGWTVEVDGERRFALPRYRDDAANTVVRTNSEEFKDRVRNAIRD